MAASPPGSGTYARCADAVGALDIGHQHLAAPDGAVGAVPRAVEGEADDRRRRVEPVFGHHGGDVGVMVLHVDDGARVHSCEAHRDDR